MRSRSASVSVGFSPVVPHGQRKWTPASICRRASRRTAASSRSPLRVNGVTSAVPTPVNDLLIVDSLLPCLPALLPCLPADLPCFPPSCLASRRPAFPPWISAFLPFCLPALRNTEYV